VVDGDLKERHSLLFVDDEPAILESLEIAFEDDYDVLTAGSGEDALEKLRDHPDVSLIIADQRMPGMTGVEFLKQSMEIRPHAVRMILTGYADIEAAIDSINSGRVYRYITKPGEPDELRMEVRLALEKHNLENENRSLARALRIANEALKRENVTLRRELKKGYRFEGIIGTSRAWQDVLNLVEQVAPTAATVIIEGESGTGKELIARAIHYNSPRAARTFISINCAAIPSHLLESELFGHEKGAFTGAVSARSGRFEEAHQGAVFLDEIGEMSRELQAKLLRVLQDGEIMRLGSNRARRVDVRVISATNRDLDQMVSAGEFREDLFFRLNVIRIKLPPLRERREDIPLLVEHFIRKCGGGLGKILSGIEEKAMEALMAHPFRGNVRELENIIERATILARGERIVLECLPPEIADSEPLELGEGIDTPKNHLELKKAKAYAREKVEQSFLNHLLRETNGNVTEAAKLGNTNRSYLQQLISKHHIDIRSFKNLDG